MPLGRITCTLLPRIHVFGLETLFSMVSLALVYIIHNTTLVNGDISPSGVVYVLHKNSGK